MMLFRSRLRANVTQRTTILKYLLSTHRRLITTETVTQVPASVITNTSLSGGKREGTIADAFASLSGQTFAPLDARFAIVKAALIEGHSDAVVSSWRRLLEALKDETSRIAALGSTCIPTISFSSLSSPPKAFGSEFRKRGVAVIRNVVPRDEALAMADNLRTYLRHNPQTKCFPSDRPSVYELYWSPPQIQARAHPRLLAAQAFVLGHWHSGSDASAPVSVATPVAYADRLRMRPPGDSVFALGPHVDGGSCERWETEGYGGREGVYSAVFRGEWEALDQWDAGARLGVTASLYNGVGACSAFRACQGWLSISTVAPFEGTLLVNPILRLATAYYLLRPFFAPRLPAPLRNGDTVAPAGTGAHVDDAYTEEYLSPDNWVLEPAMTATPSSPDKSSDGSGGFSSWLQGATPGLGQELRAALHPHLDLARTMVHIPRVEPGDYVVWHCDTIHAVDDVHRGADYSSVMYIPACPLTLDNAEYLVRQREAFLSGTPSPDFGGGIGEAEHRGRPGTAEVEAVGGQKALQAMGLAAFDADEQGLSPGEREVKIRANEILGLK